MSDNEYPQWLVDELASVLAMAVDDTVLFGDDPRYPNLHSNHSIDYIDEWRDGAVAALKHLGFERRDGWGHLPSGSKILHYGVPGQPAKHHDRWIGGTEWKEMEDN